MTDAPEIIKRARSLPEAIGADLQDAGGILRCGTCHTERPLGESVANYLRHGWPKCCGFTMTWITQRLLDEESSDG